MAANDTKIGFNCDSDREKCKYNSKMLTVMRRPPQYVKRQELKFRLGTYVTPLGGPLQCLLGATIIPRDIEDDISAKFLGVK